MSNPKRPEQPANLARRNFLGAAGGLAVAAASVGAAAMAPVAEAAANPAAAPSDKEPFWGQHQGGIVTPQQRYTCFAAFDVTTNKRDELIEILKHWTIAAARMSEGRPVYPLDSTKDTEPPADSADVLEISPARLTITFGFGPTLFSKEGVDRFGIARRRPQALVDLPRFNGDQLAADKTGGDISIQACSDDPQVAFHAVRQLARLAYGKADMKWVQNGFTGDGSKGTPRNLMGFKDGTVNPPLNDHAALNKLVWVGSEGDWMRDGSYMVVRRVRIALEHWDRSPLDFQEQVVGRHKYSGAPLGKLNEFDAADLDAADSDGNPIVPDNAHMRLASAAANQGMQILRRGYSYNDGANFTAERWPPWRQEVEFDAGLLFFGYQQDPRTGFIPINHQLAKLDIMNQFITHVGSGIFACPPGAQPGSFIGATLFG
ncbi:deferrochelatase/peroxidase EfeB [Silvimonas terrae]|uniref:Deferrochelatase n=1 Tax=Silvimonas terrae TaxID=300266 RepID=A0A840RER3_9NEIS|nr:iron uptake transporter deferrochelatase/peroxidase subunit [Silvimonas terrae]MBB5190896.1 deferrochelatase/peroxidase EfeB [Silvimonas terrae]